MAYLCLPSHIRRSYTCTLHIAVQTTPFILLPWSQEGQSIKPSAMANPGSTLQPGLVSHVAVDDHELVVVVPILGIGVSPRCLG